jgi:hypothetical protein
MHGAATCSVSMTYLQRWKMIPFLHKMNKVFGGLIQNLTSNFECELSVQFSALCCCFTAIFSGYVTKFSVKSQLVNLEFLIVILVFYLDIFFKFECRRHIAIVF